jgi:predicted RNA binding protein YcfA (HicA-like mRNA interferase family)
MGSLPGISGRGLIRLFRADGWAYQRKSRHGICLTKKFAERTRVVFIPDKRGTLPIGTLKAILGAKQSNLGEAGLQRLIDKHGI